MKKVLIVDDIENNRILLRALLEDFAQENNYSDLEIHEAVNGTEAVLIASKESFELIFMDIMMPEMDGIEATRRIRLNDSKVLLVAVSAVDEVDRQREILSNGAEDYINKPINTEIFRARLAMYDSLIQVRFNTIKYHNENAVNLFTNDIYSHKLTFFIENSDQLAEFWEYYLLNQDNASARLSATVRTLYLLGTMILRLHGKAQILIEENENSRFFTMRGVDQLDSKILRMILLKNSDLPEHRTQGSVLSIWISVESMIQNQTTISSVSSTPNPTQVMKEPQEISLPVSYHSEEQTLQVFDYMEAEDLEEIKNYIANLDSMMLIVGGGDIQSHEVNEIAHNLDRISKMMSLYSESYSISVALGRLAEQIRLHENEFIEKSASLGALCTAFSRDLSSWVSLIFRDGATSVNYMDDTIISNAKMIETMMSPQESMDEEANLDDIFDF
jgi:CheY-like chemotaxis protein